MKDLEAQLKNALQRLEVTAKKIVETRGYGRDAARLRLLIEMIKEQQKNEDTCSPARQVR
jgi:hypothetical protein